MAERTGLSRHTIYCIELAQYGTSIDHFALIARALGVETHQRQRLDSSG
ncbi:hypothetical protein [Streptomyces malaysiensis]